ncbi:MAG: folylpolyglutamate synthase/dihydrofolate synthase family protein [Oligoflexales bacterium]
MSSWVEDLFSKRSTHIRPGIETVREALKWWKPNEHINILVAGTNGKGTVVSYLWKLLQSQARIGIFTSPHLSCFSERFQVNNEVITISEVENVWKELKKSLPDHVYEELSFFEVSVLIGMGLFKNSGCEVVVWEVGLGGRLDATNALDADISIVTSIDLDHQEWLGNHIADIAKEKLGIARLEKPLLWGEKKAELNEVLEQERRRIGFDLIHTDVYLKPPSVLTLPVHLQKSYDLACHAVELLGYTVCSDQFEASTSASFYRGRCEKLQRNGRKIWIDVCHNPAAAKVFADYLKNKTHKIPVLYSILDDKDEAGILESLKQVASFLLPFSTRSARCTRKNYKANFSEQWALLERQGIKEFAVCGSFQAVTEAIELFEKL